VGFGFNFEPSTGWMPSSSTVMVSASAGRLTQGRKSNGGGVISAIEV
jgi:hypothetical protein